MLRLVELILLFSPLLAFILWRLLAPLGGPSPRVLIAAALALAVVAGTMAWFRHEEAIPTGTDYVPPTLQDGRIVPAHGAAQ
jgi:hypothetical protein